MKAEQKACEYLIDSGYKILAKNFRDGNFAEIDIIAMDGSSVVAVEVKCINSNWDENCISDKVSNQKILKICRALERFCIENHNLSADRRVDVILVKTNRMIHYKNVGL